MRKLLTAIVLVCALMMLGCSQKTPSETPAETTAEAEVIKIGVIGPMETKFGKAMVNGAQLAVDEINAQGGIDGKRLVIVQADGKLKPDVTGKELRRLAYDENVNVIIGGFSSGIVIANMDTIAEIKKVWIVECASPTVTKKIAEDYDSYKYIFRLEANSSTDVPFLLEGMNYVREKIPMKRVAIVRDQAKWVEDVDQQLKNALIENGYEVVDDIAIPPQKTDFDDVFTRVKNERADVIVAMIAHGNAVNFIKQWKDSVNIPVIGLILPAIDPNFWNETNGKCDKLLVLAPSSQVPIPINENMKNFLKNYKSKYGHLPEAYTAYESYEAVYVFKKAYEMAKANGEDPNDSDILVKYLEKINAQNPLQGVRGKIAFTKYHDIIVAKGYIVNLIIQWQNGKMVAIYPIKTGELVW
ncbi:ABC transporter substrate-binding protein [Archaeoglobus profundus]|uniref:Extracellular ligand-binding receptor n=1 Tax=Archaeoglobus profundus (strain DSM 5631 / JCM 9629 / NBRC 100127 / Av18) TaxID=572546 RepID=D2RG48_ARCPA|nr:ABC transporter substrate-binding protein [Archaeoglobus profundus]ADB57273.1 Extracellular ligand-binding receptor [Archaeoglobus profundus DSM 5631]